MAIFEHVLFVGTYHIHVDINNSCNRMTKQLLPRNLHPRNLLPWNLLFFHICFIQDFSVPFPSSNHVIKQVLIAVRMECLFGFHCYTNINLGQKRSLGTKSRFTLLHPDKEIWWSTTHKILMDSFGYFIDEILQYYPKTCDSVEAIH